MIRLSKRLQAVAHQVKSHGVTADIGCDHGFTSIYLIEQGLADHVIAMDINEGPLESQRTCDGERSDRTDRASAVGRSEEACAGRSGYPVDQRHGRSFDL